MNESIIFAYAAGVIDSDGCIYIDKRIRKGPTSYQCRVQVGMTTKEVPEWFHQNFGGSLRPTNYKGRSNTMYRWILSSQQAKKFLIDIEPYLIGKKDRAAVAIKLQDTFKGRTKKVPSDDMLNLRGSLHEELRILNLVGVNRLNYMSMKGDN